MSKKDFQRRSFIPAIHGFEERAERKRRFHRRPRPVDNQPEEPIRDEDGFIPKVGVAATVSATVYWFTAMQPNKKHLLGVFNTINEAQDKMREAHGGGPVYGKTFKGEMLDHWLLHWVDSAHANHYQRYSPDFSSFFPYDDKYAMAANYPNEETGAPPHPTVVVDPPIDQIPDAN